MNQSDTLYKLIHLAKRSDVPIKLFHNSKTVSEAQKLLSSDKEDVSKRAKRLLKNIKRREETSINNNTDQDKNRNVLPGATRLQGSSPKMHLICSLSNISDSPLLNEAIPAVVKSPISPKEIAIQHIPNEDMFQRRNEKTPVYSGKQKKVRKICEESQDKCTFIEKLITGSKDDFSNIEFHLGELSIKDLLKFVRRNPRFAMEADVIFANHLARDYPESYEPYRYQNKEVCLRELYEKFAEKMGKSEKDSKKLEGIVQHYQKKESTVNQLQLIDAINPNASRRRFQKMSTPKFLPTGVLKRPSTSLVTKNGTVGPISKVLAKIVKSAPKKIKPAPPAPMFAKSMAMYKKQKNMSR
ncbi:hypothetical protein L5515_018316 [Caenorhabditis briggsae]|uniref:Uncharacterized protein n=1 Tax=Caenorhabditis briggsae TaxID=6238 RepID=A0AAE9FGL6_CAEBR|nr:hypothetical protein L5515_018316 [Caenorhabditis briggsae]